MKSKIRSLCFIVSLVVPIALVTGLAGCDRAAKDQPAPERTAGEQIDDKALTARVKSALADNPEYKFEEVNVTTFKETVQLSGFVNTADQKSKAEEIAKKVQGVKDVENKITPKP